MTFDIVFVIGEPYFDHPLSGPAILRRLLEKYGFTVGIIANPKNSKDIQVLGEPNLFFAVSSGSIDSMLRNYTPLKKPRRDDINAKHIFDDDIDESYVPDRAIIVYSNWIKEFSKDSIIVIGGVEATLRRFTHYDYWDNKLRKPILMDSRADILCYGSAEKSVVEIAQRLKKLNENTKDDIRDSDNISRKDASKKSIYGILGTCIIAKTVTLADNARENEKEQARQFILLPSHEEVLDSKDKFCDMQNLFSNTVNLAQKVGDRFVLQFRSENYSPKDLDEYYELPFTREIPLSIKHLRGFQFSVVTHRGCVGECNFCSLTLTQGNKIISRSEKSILNEIGNITKLPHFKGNIDDLGGPSADMYGMDCIKCDKSCIGCDILKKDNLRIINLLRRARKIQGVNKINIRSGIRFDLCSSEYIREVIENHVASTLRIAPEHVDSDVLKLMNKNSGDLQNFISLFNKIAKELKEKKELSFYFMTAHPGSTMQKAQELAKFIRSHKNAESVQIFTPTPMTVSTCMYYTGMNPKTKERVYIAHTYSEKKEQKRVLM